MQVYERKVLRISGTDVADFLQGLVSNDVAKLRDGLVYAALLTPQGKLRADFFLVPDGEDILLDANARMAKQLVSVLGMYRLRAAIEISETDIPVSRGTGTLPDGAFADPRLPELGWRGYAGQAGDETDWEALRVRHCVPESGIELHEETYILEAGFERLHGVDFRKGCYVGQEVTARMKHKTTLRKGLARVTVTRQAPVGTPITRDGKNVGVLYTQSGGQAIAHLRLDRAGPDMMAGTARVAYSGSRAIALGG